MWSWSGLKASLEAQILSASTVDFSRNPTGDLLKSSWMMIWSWGWCDSGYLEGRAILRWNNDACEWCHCLSLVKMYFLVKMQIQKLYSNWHRKSCSHAPQMGAPWWPSFWSKYHDNHNPIAQDTLHSTPATTANSWTRKNPGLNLTLKQELAVNEPSEPIHEEANDCGYGRWW